MQNIEIYELWTNFVNDIQYKKYINIDKLNEWKIKLNEVKTFIDINHEKPISSINLDLSQWISRQLKNYKNKINIMKYNEIYALWENFINDDNYNKYFIDNKEHWRKRLDELKIFLNQTNIRPTDKTNKELDNWLSVQLRNYEKRKEIFKEDEIYNLWINFINDNEYKKYFISNEDKWKDNLEKLKNFIKSNNHIPKCADKDLHNWLRVQKANFKNKNKIMKNKEIYDIWKEFINSTTYSKYF